MRFYAIWCEQCSFVPSWIYILTHIMKVLDCVISSGTSLLRVGLKIVSQVYVGGRALGG
jgi:hypothetical protein